MPLSPDEELELVELELELRRRGGATPGEDSARNKPPAAVVAPQKNDLGRPWYSLAGMGGFESGMPSSADGKVTRAYIKGQMAALPMAARIAPAMLAAPGGPLLSSPAAALGEMGAQLLEQGNVSDKGAIAKAAALGAVPGGRLFKPAGLVKSALVGTAEGAAKLAAAETIGDSAQRGINQGNLAPFADGKDAINKLAFPMALGGGLGALGGVLEAALGARGTAAARRETLRGGGIEQPTLDMLLPDQAALVNRVAQGNPKLAKLRVDAQRPLVQQFEELAANAPEHEEVYAQLRPFVGQLDASRKQVDVLDRNAAALRQRATELAKSVAPSSTDRMVAEAEATASELNAINAKARMLHEANANLGGFMDYDSAAQQFRGVVDQLFTTRKSIGAAKFAAANIPENAPIFPKEELVAAAKAGLNRFRGSDMEKQILSAIQDAGGEEAPALNLAQFRELRQAFTDRFAGMDPRQLSIYEAAGRDAYGALTSASKKMIAQVPGANLPAYEDALGYWRQTAEAQSSRYARPLLAREASESTFQTLANDLASGKKAEVRAFNDFVGAVAQDAPEVARLASQQLTGAVRNSFLGNARTGFGVDTKKLTDALLRAQGQIDVGTLGFGSPTDIKRWGATFKEYGLNNVKDADLDEIFSSPQVQQALLDGKPLGDAVKPAAARVAFQNNVRTQVLASLAGSKAQAAEAAAKASKLADAAELTLKDRRAILAEIEADPIAQAFGGGQSYGIPSRPGGWTNVGDTNAVTTTVLNLGPKQGPQLLEALRAKNGGLAELLQRRMVADTMQFFRPANTPGHVWALDKSKVQRFFSPAPGSGEASHAETVRRIVGDSKFAAMKKIVDAVQMVADVEKGGGVMSTDGAKTIFTSSGLARGIGMGAAGNTAPSLTAAALKKAQQMVDGGRYHALSLLVSNKPFAETFWRSGGNVGASLEAIGPQRVGLLMQDAMLRRELGEADDR